MSGKTIVPASKSLNVERIKNEDYYLRLTTELANMGRTESNDIHEWQECEFQCTGIIYDAVILNEDYEAELFSLYKAKAYTHMYISVDEHGNPFKTYAVCIDHNSGKETYKTGLTEAQATAMFMNFLKKHNF